MQVTHRRPRPGPETDLLDGALRSGLPFGRRGKPVLLREPEIGTGAPDLVAVYHRHGVAAGRSEALGELHFRVLHQLWRSGGTSLGELGLLINLSVKALERTVGELLDAELVWARGGHLSARSLASIFPARHIIAVEAKVSDWRGAIEQARMNLWFASESYILVPSRINLAPIVECAASVDVGVLGFDGQRTRRWSRPEPRRIPASFGSWVLGEWSVRQHAALAGD